MQHSCRDQVDESEDHDPHDVDEVPVQTDQLDDLRLVAVDAPLGDIATIESSMMMPTDTCTPWKPVSVDKLDENRLVVNPRPS